MDKVPDIGTFFTRERMDTMWSYVYQLTKYVSPGVMIVVAILLVGLLLSIIFTTIYKAYNYDKDSDKNDDVDMRYY